jgi:tRNA pseudouridine38-40 synthase
VTEPAAQDLRAVKLMLHYDGGGFFGWQIQPGARTVQQEVESALSRLTDRPTTVIAAGRTDTGVHATGQVVSALVPPRWDPAELRRALNAILPVDVWVASAADVPSRFHARFDAVARAYIYRVGTEAASLSPFLRRWCWPIARPLDATLLEESARRFHGERSFRAFSKAGQPERGERCTVFLACWNVWPDIGFAFHVTANRFLHHMVRYMVGTMVDVARGRRPLDDIDRLLAAEPGVETSPPAPAAGLFLSRVYYDENQLRSKETPDEVFPR